MLHADLMVCTCRPQDARPGRKHLKQEGVGWPSLLINNFFSLSLKIKKKNPFPILHPKEVLKAYRMNEKLRNKSLSLSLKETQALNEGGTLAIKTTRSAIYLLGIKIREGWVRERKTPKVHEGDIAPPAEFRKTSLALAETSRLWVEEEEEKKRTFWF